MCNDLFLFFNISLMYIKGQGIERVLNSHFKYSQTLVDKTIFHCYISYSVIICRQFLKALVFICLFCDIFTSSRQWWFPVTLSTGTIALKVTTLINFE